MPIPVATCRAAAGDELPALFLAHFTEIRNEVVIDLGSKKISIEVQLHSVPRAQDAGALTQCIRDLKLTRGYLVHSGRQRYSLGNGVTALPAKRY